MADQMSEEEQRAQNIFAQYLGYKRVAARLGQELEQSRQKIIDLQAERSRLIKSTDTRIAEMKQTFDNVMRMRDRREARLEEDLQELRRELTELATRVSFIKESCDEAENAAVAARHTISPPKSPPRNQILAGVERELFGAKKAPEPPTVAEMRERPNLLKTLVDASQEDDRPLPSIFREPIVDTTPPDRKSTDDALAELAKVVSSDTPPLAPQQTEERATERQS